MRKVFAATTFVLCLSKMMTQADTDLPSHRDDLTNLSYNVSESLGDAFDDLDEALLDFDVASNKLTLGIGSLVAIIGGVFLLLTGIILLCCCCLPCCCLAKRRNRNTAY